MFSFGVCFFLLLQYHQPEASDSALSRAVELILDGSLSQYFLYSYDLINIMRVSESLPRPTHSKWMQVMATSGFRRYMRVWLKKLHSRNISLCFRVRWWEHCLISFCLCNLNYVILIHRLYKLKWGSITCLFNSLIFSKNENHPNRLVLIHVNVLGSLRYAMSLNDNIPDWEKVRRNFSFHW